MNTPTLKYYKLNKNALDPKYGSSDSACFDIAACIDPGHPVKMFRPETNEQYEELVGEDSTIIIPPRHRALVPTGLIFVIDEGWSVRVHARSGNAIRLGLVLANGEGVIDWGYWHEALQPIINTSDTHVKISHGDRVCQAELVPMVRVDLLEVFDVPTQRTDRVGGFGSTGGVSANHS